MYSDSSGAYNTALGGKALFSNKSGNSNVTVGFESFYNAAGSGNVGLGYRAGYLETGSNKLYIDNSNTSLPLIYGDFNANDLTINGDLSYTGSLTSLSDKRLKTNIKHLRNSLDRLSHLQGYTYSYSSDAQKSLLLSSNPQIGLLAQELEVVYPELVKDHVSGYKSVNATQLIPALVSALNELHSKVIHLEHELNEARK
jgi:hypothetical protein